MLGARLSTPTARRNPSARLPRRAEALARSEARGFVVARHPHQITMTPTRIAAVKQASPGGTRRRVSAFASKLIRATSDIDAMPATDGLQEPVILGTRS
jgi:hypothetical protein